MEQIYSAAEYLLRKYGKQPEIPVSFRVDPTLSGDDYRIEKKSGTLVLWGNTPVAFNAAVGKLLRLGDRAEEKTYSFAKPFRAVYFANHFYNYYHSAPVEDICAYLEQLALWGQNILTLWFDMHHFSSPDDPHARAMLGRMEALYAKAKQLGMETMLTHLGNEYYSESDPALRAEWSLENGLYKLKPTGFFHTELCPAKPESTALLLESFRQLWQRLQRVGVDYLMLFPYDQGGCTCRDCYPWGANGFFKIAKQKAAVAREIAPDTKIVLATWRFGLFCDGEWEAFVPAVKADGGWIDYLLVDVDFYIPDELFSLGIPVVSFPEISMHGAVPWGGFGANPFPALMGQRIAQKGERCQGGNMYSEGIYEDINKIVTLELFRDPSLSVKEILREYAAWYFDGQYTDELAALMLLLEETLPRSVRDRDGRACDYPVGPQSDLPTVKIMQPQRVEEIAQRFLVLDQKLPRQVRKSWRYRILYLRALGDAALVRNGGVPNEETDRYYGQLAQLFHGDEAYYFVGPFTRQAFLTNRSDGGEL